MTKYIIIYIYILKKAFLLYLKQIYKHKLFIYILKERNECDRDKINNCNTEVILQSIEKKLQSTT